MYVRHSLVALLVSCAALSAQKVVPAFAANYEGNSQHAYPLSYTQQRVQILIDAAELSTTTMIINSVGFRPDGSGSTDNFAATKLNPTLTIYESPLNATTMSKVWASNIGTSAGTVVFQGTLDVPAYVRKHPVPEGFFSIRFSRPYVFQPTAGNLLLDWTETNTYVFSRWNGDAVSYPTTAASLTNDVWANSACVNARGDSADISTSRTKNVLGGTLEVTFTMTPSGSNVLDLMVLLFGDTNQKLGGTVPLPIDLTPAGFPSCALAINPIFTFAGTTSPIAFPLPSDPALDGVFVFVQGIAIDTTNVVMVPTKTALQIGLIGNPPKPQGYQSVFRPKYTTEVDGSMSSGFYYAPVLLFS